jgi:beta-glucosidase
MIRGFQGDSLDQADSLAACAKHYVGYGAAEAGRDYNSTWIPETLLRDVYLRPFRAARDAGVASVMTAFNSLNGVPASGNRFTVHQILRDEWKFDGVVVSDYQSVTEMIEHGYAADPREAALKAVQAGVDMVSTSYFDNLKFLADRQDWHRASTTRSENSEAGFAWDSLMTRHSAVREGTRNPLAARWTRRNAWLRKHRAVEE